MAVKKTSVAFGMDVNEYELPLRECMPVVCAMSIVPRMPSVLVRLESMKDGRDL